GRTGELPIGDARIVVAISREDPGEARERLVAGLVAKTSRAGVDHEGDLPLVEPEGGGRFFVEDLIDALHLEEVVAAAERAHLALASRERALAHRFGIRAAQAPALLAQLGVVAPGEVAAIDRPLCA